MSDDKRAELAARIQRLKDVASIHNLMSRYAYYSAAFAFDELVGTFAQRTDGVTVELAGSGVYEGLDGVRRSLVDPLADMVRRHDEGMRRSFPDLERTDPKAGLMLEGALTTPVLHVAADGATAKGLWMAMGAQSVFNPDVDEVEAVWTWVHLAVDFVREETGAGAWRIWHLRVAPRWRAPYDQSWAVVAAQGLAPLPEGLAPTPDRPSTSSPTDYAPDRVPVYEPRAPLPYDTFANTFSY